MLPEIEKLIDFAIADGVITEKGKEVLYRKAKELKVDIAEFEMILHSKLYQKQQELKMNLTSTSSEKLGKIKKCPSCGEVVNPLDIKCSSCGFELNITTSNRTLNEFLNKLMELGENKKGSISKKTDLILHFPIPNNKEDLFEFISICIPQIEQNESTLNKFEKKILTAWLLKSQQLFIKGNSLFKDDKDFIRKIGEFEINVEKKLKQIKKRILLVSLTKILGIIIFLCCIFLYWQKVINKKSHWELFVESVEEKYGEEFNKYKVSDEYKGYLITIEKTYHMPNYGIIPTWENLCKSNIGISDIKFYIKAVNYLSAGNEELASPCLDTALALNPNFAYAYYCKGRLFPNSIADSSIKYFNKAIEMRQDIWKFYYHRSIAYYNKKAWPDALDDISRAVKISPNNVLLLFQKSAYLHDSDPYGKKWCKDLELLKLQNDYKLIKNDFGDELDLLNKSCENKNDLNSFVK